MDSLTDMTSDVDVLSRQYQIRSDAIVPRRSQDAPSIHELSRIRELHLSIWQIVKERDELRARIAALSAPPTEADILDAAQKIYEVKKAIGLACMYEGGADDIAVDYDIDKESAKAAIEAFMKGRGV